MIIHQLTTASLAIHTYIVADPVARKAVVVDPTRDITPITSWLKSEGLQVTHILETHVHADYVTGAPELQRALGPGAVIVSSSMGGPEWIPSYAQQLVKHGDAIRAGAVRLEALHTPGHTPEHLTWIVFDESRNANIPCLALTGDFLLVGTVGRPDLLGQAQGKALSHQLYQSVFQGLSSLPDHLEIFPAHSAGSFCAKDLARRTSSTLGYERRTNPALKSAAEATWVNALLKQMPRAPDYYARVKQINQKGPPLMHELKSPPQMTLQQLSPLNPQQVAICDLRFPEPFAACHLAGSINLPLRPAFAQWAADVLSPEIPLYLLVPDERALATALMALRLVGLDRCDGFALVAEEALKKAYVRLSSFSVLPPESLQEQCVLDVRAPHERAHGHPPHSLAVELGMLSRHLDQIPKDRTVAVLCRSGYRSSIAASLLARAGFRDVASIRGGMEAWKKAGLPVATSSVPSACWQ
jgi:hydroxyacylglutathione hydrolase